MSNYNNTFLITIDVEDWFQVENFKAYIPRSAWGKYELRVERNTYRLLDLFEELRQGSRVRGVEGSRGTNEEDSRVQGFKGSSETNQTYLTNKTNSVRATFFILGWIAERLPNLIRDIHNRGHEVASHGFGHDLCSKQQPAALKADLIKSKKLLEDIIGAEVYGYRAPSFSVNNDVLKIIEDAGYRYDASYNSFDKHGRYGKLNTNGYARRGISYRISDRFHELPLSNLLIQPSAFKLQPFVFPLSGGGYFRVIPGALFNKGVQYILDKDAAYHFYMHPWEIDPFQPRVDEASTKFKFRHYINLRKTENKLKKMINRFRHCSFDTCSEYIKAHC